MVLHKEAEAQAVEVGEFRSEADKDESGEVERKERRVRVVFGVVGRDEESRRENGQLDSAGRANARTSR